MRVVPSAVESASADHKHWYRWGGICALLLAFGYLIIIPLFVHVGQPPSSGDAWFKYLPGKTTVWWAILGVSVFTDLLYIPIAFALCVALQSINKKLMLLAAAFMGMFVVLDLAVTWGHHASILALYHNYTVAADAMHRAAYLAAAEYASALLATPILIVYAIAIPSTGILLTGIVMLKGVFSRTTAYLGLVTGILGIVSLSGFYPAIMANALLATVWFFFVGWDLLGLARI